MYDTLEPLDKLSGMVLGFGEVEAVASHNSDARVSDSIPLPGQCVLFRMFPVLPGSFTANKIYINVLLMLLLINTYYYY